MWQNMDFLGLCLEKNLSLLFLSLRLRYLLVDVSSCDVLRELMDSFERYEMYEKQR